MNPSTSAVSPWLRLCLNAGFVLVLVCTSFAKAAPGEWTNGKALQQSITEFKCASNGLFSDPPESKAVSLFLEHTIVASVPWVLGAAQEQQFNPMVHQLRDRLMHAPPVTL